LAFTFLYTLIIVVSTLIMMALGMGFVESIGCAVSSLGNMGPGLGSCGPAFSWDAIPEAAKWLNALLMLLGRLEIFTVFLLFTPDFWHRN
jgi:trk system potassium uptake protein TrkH